MYMCNIYILFTLYLILKENYTVQYVDYCLCVIHFRTNSVSGKIIVNGRERDMSAFRKFSAYIMQDDNLQPLLTVQESMLVAADLKLTLSHYEKLQKVCYIEYYQPYIFAI